MASNDPSPRLPPPNALQSQLSTTPSSPPRPSHPHASPQTRSSRHHPYLESEARAAKGPSRRAEDLDPTRQWPTDKGKPLVCTAKNWFLTFPRCATTKEEAMERLKSKFKETLFAAEIAQEQHKESPPPGTTVESHLHILVMLTKKLSIRSPKYFDFLCSKHGNYQTCNTVYGSRNYLNKEDPSTLKFGDLPLPGKTNFSTKTSATDGKITPSRAKATTIAKSFLSGSLTPNDLLTEDPGYYMLNKQKVDAFYSVARAHLAKKSLKPWNLLEYRGTCSKTALIIEWLRSNIRSVRHLKQRHLYVSGPPNTYKTTMVTLLEEFLSTFDFPTSEEFFDFWHENSNALNPIFDLVKLDEFKGQIQIQVLNRWLEGAKYTLRKKGSQFMKETNPPCLITSNYSLDQCYRKALEKNHEALDSLKTRLDVLELSEPVDILGFARALGLPESRLEEMRIWISAVPKPMLSAPLPPQVPVDSSIAGIIRPANTVIAVGTAATQTVRIGRIATGVTQAISAAASAISNLRRNKGKQPDLNFCMRCGEEMRTCSC